MEKAIEPLLEASSKRSISARINTEQAIRWLQDHGEKINVSSVAKQAGVSKNYIYSKPELFESIAKLRDGGQVGYSEKSKDSVIAAFKKELGRKDKIIETLRTEDLNSESWHAKYEQESKKARETNTKYLALKKENDALRKQLEAAYSLEEIC